MIQLNLAPFGQVRRIHEEVRGAVRGHVLAVGSSEREAFSFSFEAVRPFPGGHQLMGTFGPENLADLASAAQALDKWVRDRKLSA